MNNKLIGVFLLFLISILFINSCAKNDSNTSENNISTQDINKIIDNKNAPILDRINTAKLTDYLKAGKEQKVKSFNWTDENKTLNLGLVDDGSNRKGYAEYICLTARDYNITHNFKINIVNYSKMVKKGEVDIIGTYDCNIK